MKTNKIRILGNLKSPSLLEYNQEMMILIINTFNYYMSIGMYSLQLMKTPLAFLLTSLAGFLIFLLVHVCTFKIIPKCFYF